MATQKTENVAESPVKGENAATNIQAPIGQEKAVTGTPGGIGEESASEGRELYAVEDFVAATETLFPDKKTRPSRYLVAAAFKVSGVESATKDEGIRIIKEFMGRKVE